MKLMPDHSSVAQNDERRFLHDISSPLGAVIFNLDSLLDHMQSHVEKNKSPSEELNQIIQIYNTMEVIRKMIHERRRVLVERESLRGK